MTFRTPPRSSQRGSGPLIALAAVVLLPAAALFGLWQFASARSAGDPVELPPTTLAANAAPAPAGPLNTPLLSFRRVSGLLGPDVDLSGFAAELEQFAATLDSTSCVAVSVDGTEVIAHNADLALIPASTMKVFTGAAALQALGADHQFTTELRVAGGIGATIAGDVYLVGGGDPLLMTDDYDPAIISGYPVPDATSLDALADQLVEAGVTSIGGAVIGDGSRFDDMWYYDDWDAEDRVTEAGPLSALLVNDSRSFDGAEWFVSEDPNVGAAHELTRLLEARGITVGADPASGVAPGEADVVASVTSKPLSAVVGEMMATSDNNTAELLLKEMGLASGATGSRADGLVAMKAALTELGVDLTGQTIADGAGLTNDNGITCRGLMNVLEHHGPDDPLGAGMPVAGESGTLAEAFVDTPMAGLLIGKTGSLFNGPPFNQDPPSVKALAGYVPMPNGSVVSYALVLNDPDDNVADMSVNRPVWNAFAAALGTFPDTEAGPDLGPR